MSETVTLTEEGIKTINIDVRQYPRCWSVLASAIIKQYECDRQKDCAVYIDEDWYECLLELATRYTSIGLQTETNELNEIKNYYLTHSVLETCNRFGFTKNKLKYYLRSKGIKKNKQH